MKKVSIVALVIAVSLITLLIIAGPVRAFNLALELQNTNIRQGGTTTLIASVTVDSDEEDLTVDRLRIIFIGPQTLSCAFSIEGEKISSCDFVTNIVRLEENSGDGYGYGYDSGYGYGYSNFSRNLRYTITVNTDNFAVGTYQTRLEASVDGEIFSADGENLIVRRAVTSHGNVPTFLATSHGNTNNDTIIITNNFRTYNPLSVQQGDRYALNTPDYNSYNMNVNSINDNRVALTVDNNDANVGFEDHEFYLGNGDKITMSLVFSNGKTAEMIVKSDRGIEIVRLQSEVQPRQIDNLVFQPVWVDETAKQQDSLLGLDLFYIIMLALVLFNLILLMLVLIVAVRRSRRPRRVMRKKDTQP